MAEKEGISAEEQAFLDYMDGKETPQAEKKEEPVKEVKEEIKAEAPKKEEVKEEKEISLDEPVSLDDEEEKVVEPTDFPDEINKFIAERYSDVGIKDGKELEAIISRAASSQKLIDELNAKLEEATNKANPFENDAQKKLFEFAKSFNGTNAKVLAEYEHLQSLDVPKMGDKEALKEAFVQANKEFGRSKAERMFELDYEDTYDTESLDSDMDAKEIEKRTYRLERDANNAKKQLAETVAKFKPEVSQKVETVEDVRTKQEIEKVLSVAESELPKIKTLEVKLDKNGTQKMAISLSEEQKAYVTEQSKKFLANPSNYVDGKLVHNQTPQSVFEFITWSAYKDQLVAKAFQRGLQVKQMEYVEKQTPKAQKPLTSNSSAHSVARNDQEAFEAYLASN